MKWAAIRSVCLVLTVQIVALGDAKSIVGPPLAAYSLSPSTTATNNETHTGRSNSRASRGDKASQAAAAATAAAGSGDPAAGQERHPGTASPVVNPSAQPFTDSRFVRYVPKYSIDHLLEHIYESKISNDIDLDPCKTVIAMGDIALPNINYESQWQSQRFNKSFQEELETLKKEVYNEGLQVEEEGLTDIIRKKTKQIVVVDDEATNNRKPPAESSTPTYSPLKTVDNDRERNNAAILVPEDEEDASKFNFKSHPHLIRGGGESEEGENEQEQDRHTVVATIIDNRNSSTTTTTTHHSPAAPSSADNVPLETTPSTSSASPDPEIPIAKNASARHNETDKIQSNSKDIVIEDFNWNAATNSGGHGSASSSSSPATTNNRRATPGTTTTPTTATSTPRIQRKRRQQERSRKGHKVVVTEEEEKDTAPQLSLAVGLADFQYTDSHRRVTRAATAKKERIWDHGVIPYEIDANFSGAHKALFKQAMRHWENFTCIKFVERNPDEHPNYIVFTERSCGCCSYVGKRGNGAQAISIGKNCDKFGIVVHELGHVVGFWHEHTRPDREKHVVIEKTNILNGQEYNFNKLSDDDVNSLGLPYDYHSIMHYARNTFSKSTHLDTIHPVEIKGTQMPEIGQRIRLSDGDIAQTNLLYKCPKCGQTFQDNAGTFASPHYFASGPPLEPEKCEWRITATHGEKIVLNITDLDIFKSNNCRTDYLEIRDGYWHKSPTIGKFCGSGKVNELFTTTSSRMLITYVTSHRQGHHKGFTANYEAVCGGELRLEAGGRIESPNYPLDYLPNKECIWRITVPEEYQVALKFQSFEVENHDNCVYDYVEVRDGDRSDSRLIGVFCGYKIPPDMRSTGNKLYLKFVSDGSVQKAGFSATYMKEVDECETHNHGCQHECINTLGGYECSCNIGYELHSDKKTCENACGGIIDTHNGTITSPSFPEVYPLSKDCVWEIVAPPQYKIILNFTHFDLEGSNFFQAECDYDSLTVYSKTSEENMKRHGLFCGPKLPPMITSESNVLRIEFTSDSTIQKSGFAAIFLTDIDECTINNGGCQHECKNTIGSYLCSCHNGYMLHENGHDCREGGCKYEVTAPHGQIASPNYPDYYPANKDCVWHFSTTPGHRIRLQFTNFEIEPHQECVYDSIMIYDGESTDSHTLGRFCGSKLPHVISASSNEMYMVFKSDASIQRNGFLATHSTSCGGYLQATNKVKHFYSHARYGHSSYDKLANCDWTIEAEMGKNIQLTFLTFDIEDEQACSFDYVEIFDGFGDSRGSSYGKFCGSTNPPDIISQSEALLVRFQSDETMVFKGFSVSYVAVVPFDDDEEMSSDSEEAATPFPGSLRSIRQEVEEEEEEEDIEGSVMM